MDKFETNLLSCHQNMKTTAIYLTNNKTIADDLVQETYLTALRFRHKYQDNTNMNAWVTTIMRNIFINSYRREKYIKDAKKRAPHVDEICQNEFENAADTGPIEQAILMLPGKFRDAIEMLSNETPFIEMSAITGDTVGAIKTRIHRGRKMLKKLII